MQINSEQMRISLSCLNQHAIAFGRNSKNILASISEAAKRGSHLRTGLPLEAMGLSSGDHFKEHDTVDRCWLLVRSILKEDLPADLLVEVGMPVRRQDEVFNCLVYLRNKRVELIRPKTRFDLKSLQSDAAIFSFHAGEMSTFQLPASIEGLASHAECRFGVEHLDIRGHKYMSVFAEELQDGSVQTLIQGADIVNLVQPRVFELKQNAEFRQRLADLSSSNDRLYLNSNFVGSDGTVLLSEGGAYLGQRGVVRELIPRFSYEDVETCTVDVRREGGQLVPSISDSSPQEYSENEPEELIEAMASHLWNELVKTTASGFFIPLSGGADSCTTACAVYRMSKRIFNGGAGAKAVFSRIVGVDTFTFTSVEEMTNKILFTVYMPMHFSNVTKGYSFELAKRLNSNHFELPIQKVYEAVKELGESTFGLQLNFESQGGSIREDLALQSVQARSRLVVSYLAAQVIPVKFHLRSFLIVMATGNCSEVVRGYYSRYDNSSGDVNVMGSLVKRHIKDVLRHLAKVETDFAILQHIANQAPTAELKPNQDNKVEQTDEADMGFSYEELDFLTEEYKVGRKGFDQLIESFEQRFQQKYSRGQVVLKIQWFYRCLLRYRYKCVTLPPSVHLTAYDLDHMNDNRPGFYDSADIDFQPMK